MVDNKTKGVFPMTTLQTEIQTRHLGEGVLRSPLRVYARIFNSTGRKTPGTLYKFLADSQDLLVCVVNDPDHSDFLIATGNFSSVPEVQS